MTMVMNALGCWNPRAALQLVVGYFTVAAIGLISVPPWGIVLLAAAWLVGGVALVRLARSRPAWTLLVPAANGLFLWAVVTAGDIRLGWTA
ncbi:MAG: hypothetical protein ACRDUY_00185 [Nitriliruptorales bacterium]